MSTLRSLFAGLCLGLVLLSPGLASAEPPAPETVQRSLDGLSDRKLPESEHNALKTTLEKTLEFLASRTDSQQRLESLKRQLRDAPKLISEAQAELQSLQASAPVNVNHRYAQTNVAQLEQLLVERGTQLSAWQQQLAEANSLLITAQTRPERAQAEISSNQSRLLQIDATLKSGRQGNKPLSAEQRDQLNAELVALNAITELRRQELAGNSLLQDLGSSRQELLKERIHRLEQESLDLQALISVKRRESSEQTVEKLSREAEKATPDSLLAKESAANLKLSDYLLKATERLNNLNRQNLEVKQQLDNVTQAGQALNEQIDVLKGSLLLAKILYQQKQALPKLDLDDSDLADQIADIRLYQFELNQARDKLGNTQSYVDELLASQPPEQITPELIRTLSDLANTRSQLLDRMNSELNALLNASITLQLNQKQLQQLASQLRTTLDEQMFWIPSNKPLDKEWLEQVPQLLDHQLARVPWGSALRELGAGLGDRPWLFIPLGLLIAVLLWRRHWLYDKLSDIHQDVGHYKRDSQLHTPLALLINLLLALPGALFLALGGMALLLDARGQNANLGNALLLMAQAWLVFYTLYRILAPNGVAEIHFHWARPQVTYLRRQVRSLGAVVMALVAVVTVAEHQPATLAEDVIGVFVVLACFALMALLLGRLLLAGPMREEMTPIRQLIGLAFTLLPLGLIVAVGFGYYYTSLKLTDRLINTLYLLILWLVLEAVVERGLSVAARRLAYQRAMAKRQAQAKENLDGETLIEEPTLDIEQVNQQSLRLMRLALLAGFIGCLYLVWADLISVFTYLDNITLYQYSSGTGDSASQVPISLLDVLGALIIVAITIALARNLPGLLEVLVLSRMKLAQGSAYATTTLLSYVLAGIGFVATLSTLGLSWDKLQWLVAALSVGIGFGMQEIFANFISGLIILFERPVRIGDVVTIGNLSGTVSRIRIRATTITDFDRKEIIVPNKTFITSQLVNWSLTDTVTRVTLQIGVGYGSDLELVRKLLLQAARENPRVLRDPEPLVYFLTFAESTLNHELRIHVRDLGDRNPATDEINRFIDREFRANNIEIAFRQLDVHVRGLDGGEFQLLQHKSEPGEAAKRPDQPEPPTSDGE